MPPVVAAVAAYFAVSAATATFIIASAVLTLASVAYSAYMMATMEKPTGSDAAKRLSTVRSSVQPHRIIYGECMTGGVLVYAQSHGENNKFITLVVAFTGHEIEEIKEVWLNDKPATDSAFIKHIAEQPAEFYYTYEGEYVETRAYAPGYDMSYASIIKYLGTDSQTADQFLTTLPAKPTTLISQYPQSGLNDMTAKGDYSAVGMAVYSLSITSTTPDVCHWVKSEYLGDGTKTETLSGNITINGSDQLLSDGISVKFAAVTGHSIGQTWEVRAFDGAPWTPECRLRGRSYVIVTLEDNHIAFPNGLPNIKALIRGNNKIYDPRTETTGYSDNYALCVRDYLTKHYGLNCPIEDINESFAISAANLCDEIITLSSGTQKRYTINGSFTVDKTPTAIMNEILATAYGAITWTQGQYRILPSAYYVPDLTFHGMNAAVPGLTESDLRGPIKVRPMASMKDRFNTVKGTYISVETWQPVDFPPVTNALYVSQDGGEVVSKDIQLSYVTDPARAQRIAKIMLEKSRQGIAVDFPAKWSAFPLAVGDNVPISINHLGWVGKIFTVRDWKMNPDGGVDLVLQEDAIGCYSWNNGEETTVDLAPNTLLPDSRFVDVPTGLVTNVRIVDTNNGTSSRVDLYVIWVSAGSGIRYQVQYQETSGAWFSLPDTADTLLIIPGLPSGTYNVRVRSINSIGAVSEWVDSVQFVPSPDTFVPNVTGLELFDQGNNTNFVGKHIKLRWNKVTPRSNDIASGVASPATYPGWFRYYELLIYAGSILLRTEPVPAETYDYDYEKNYKDCLDKGLTSASRTISFELRAVATWGDSSAIAAKLTATNAASPVPANITGTSFIGGLMVSFDPLNIPDLLGYEIHASQSAGFTPSGHEAGSGTCINSGSESSFFQKQAVYGTWYVKVGSYDTFGTDGMVYSADVTVTVATPASVMLEELKDKLGYGQFAPGVYPVRILAELPTLPDPLYPQGVSVTLTTDNQLYRSTGTAWTASIPAVGIVGQLTNDQIAAVGAAKISGQLTDAQIAAIASTKMTGQITSTQITDDAVTTAKIAANAVTASEIAAGAVVAGKIAALAVTATEIAAGAITAGKIAAGTIVAGDIAANTITGAKLVAGTITATELATDSITSSKILAGAITVGKLAAGAIIAGDAVIANAAISSAQIISLTADKILTGTMTASQSITVGGMIIDAGTSANNGNIRLGKTSATDNTNNGFWLGNVAGVATFNMQGGTITGSVIQTAASGERFVVDVATKSARFYNAAELEKVWIGTASAEGYNTYGVFGSASAGEAKTGIVSVSNSGTGFFARSVSGKGMHAISDSSNGVYGASNTGVAIYGTSSGAAGVHGHSLASYGVVCSSSAKAPLLIVPDTGTTSPNGIETALVGAIWVTAYGDFYGCKGDGVGGAGTIWVKLNP